MHRAASQRTVTIMFVRLSEAESAPESPGAEEAENRSKEDDDEFPPDAVFDQR